MEEGEFRLAQLCGLNIIINADDLEEVLRHCLIPENSTAVMSFGLRVSFKDPFLPGIRCTEP